jgi:hypothetical protein
MLHLDSEYKDRYELYHLLDNTTKDSRKINWRNIEWEKLEKIEFLIHGKIHQIDKSNKKNFKFFMRFRWGGREAQYDIDGKFTHYKQINTWTFGWSDGKKAYLSDFDFKTGFHLKDYEMELMRLKTHIHPRVKI